MFDDALLLRSCELTDAEEAMMSKFVFEITGTGDGVLSSTLAKKTLTVSCNTLEEKKSWMNDVNMAINSIVSDKQLAIATDNKALTALDLDKVAANMRHPASGVPVKARKRRLQVFANAFVGSDAVDVRDDKFERLFCCLKGGLCFFSGSPETILCLVGLQLNWDRR